MGPSLEWELRVGHPGQVIVGIDEVGRGCLAGPVVAAAVALAPSAGLEDAHLEALPWLAEVSDSKLVKPGVRERLAPLIEGWALSWAVGVASVEEIDRINIFHASHLAMKRALDGLRVEGGVHHVLVDGNAVPRGLHDCVTAVVKGDLRCLSIAAASILAKVWRDRHMTELDAVHPGYGFGVHKGYGTPEHAKVLRKLGVCAIHRRSFAPVAALCRGETAPRAADSTRPAECSVSGDEPEFDFGGASTL